MKNELMLYLHVPFCVRKCNYCDFLSAAQPTEKRELYVKALQREIRERGKEVSGRIVTSVFFGGGTPSLLSHGQIFEIMTTIRETFVLSEDAEITMECNPGTVDEEKLKKMHEIGINRLSIGLQSMKDEELKLLGRIHDAEAFLQTYEQARSAGFANVSVDLMNALPGQTMEAWKETLEKVLALKPMPEHVSVYSLILEEGTRFFEWNLQGRFTGKLAIPTEEEDREMYAYTGRRLAEAGLLRYEISNYAKEGFECRHNLGYWTRREYLGLGIGAASLLGNVRFSNETNLESYLANPLAGRQKEVLGRRDQMEEYAFLGLRTIRGISRKEFQEAFGESLDLLWGDVIRKNAEAGLLMDDGEFVSLSERGLDLDNYVSAQFLLD